MGKSVIAYVPVVHRGYLELFKKHKDADRMFVLGNSLIREFHQLSKDIRALDPSTVARILSHELSSQVGILEQIWLQQIVYTGLVIMPEDEVSRELAERYLGATEVVFEPVFLRHTRHNSLESKRLSPDHVISIAEMDRQFMELAVKQAQRSSDSWRQVGAVLVKHGRVIAKACNQHLPTEYSPWIDGDPRDNFSRGQYLELSTAEHAEASVIAQAARRGNALQGAGLYVSTFPCPPCAKLIAACGIDRLYYTASYGIFDGEQVLKDAGVTTYFVKMKNP